jgi:TATA-binding protein-associated factor
VTIHAELRGYQQSGIDWMNFLRKYQLHGILCDDMGLGKEPFICFDCDSDS